MNIDSDGLDMTDANKPPVTVHPRVSVLSSGTSDVFLTSLSLASGGSKGGSKVGTGLSLMDWVVWS